MSATGRSTHIKEAVHFISLQFKNLRDTLDSNNLRRRAKCRQTSLHFNVTYRTSIIVSTIFKNFVKSASESSEFWDYELSCESRMIDHHVLFDTTEKQATSVFIMITFS